MARFIDNGDNTVTDTQTGLTWSQKTISQDLQHASAEKAAAEFGPGFRLPTVTELFSLVDHEKHGPAIDTEFFPDTRNDCYWTSTPCALNDAAVWVVDFTYGAVNGSYRHGLACVRAVRSSQ